MQRADDAGAVARDDEEGRRGLVTGCSRDCRVAAAAGAGAAVGDRGVLEVVQAEDVVACAVEDDNVSRQRREREK